MITRSLKEFSFGSIILDEYLDYSYDLNKMADVQIGSGHLMEMSDIYSPCSLVCIPSKIREDEVLFYTSGHELVTALILASLGKEHKYVMHTYFAGLFDITDTEGGNSFLDQIKDFCDDLYMNVRYNSTFGKSFTRVGDVIKRNKSILKGAIDIIDRNMPKKIKNNREESSIIDVKFFTKTFRYKTPTVTSEVVILNCSDFCAPLMGIKSCGNSFNALTKDNLKEIKEIYDTKADFSSSMLETSLFTTPYPTQVLLAELIYRELN